MKHAYLIMAHNEPKILQVLLSLIDDPRNDIFLHVDVKADIDIENLYVRYSNLYLIERHDVRWGDQSLSQCELDMIEVAVKHGGYVRYHLLSGVDLPIKSQDYIHRLMDECNLNVEFVGYKDDSKENMMGIKIRTQYYHFLLKYRRSKRGVARFFVKCVNKSTMLLQDIFHIYRKYPYELKKGCNWASITDNFAKYLIERKNEILKMYRYTNCSDELFLHSALWNSPFRNNIYKYGYGEYAGCLRYIIWAPNTCSPKILDMSSKEEIMRTDAIFARKFSSRNMDIVNFVKDKLLKK